jgi:hypothetical protein
MFIQAGEKTPISILITNQEGVMMQWGALLTGGQVTRLKNLINDDFNDIRAEILPEPVKAYQVN